MSSYSNYLIDSGYYDITPEQERELIEARAENAALTADGGKPCDTARAARCIPPDPDREGYHWIRRFRGGPAIPLHWNPTWWRNADRGWGVWGQPDRESEWEYLGPCPSPDDASTLSSQESR